MKTFSLILLLQLITLSSFSQFVTSEKYECEALILFVKNSNGIYTQYNNVRLDKIEGNFSIYAYDNKNNRLYLANENSNCVVTVKDKKIARQLRKHLSQQNFETNQTIRSKTDELAKKFSKLNELRMQFIEDSTKLVKNAFAEAEKVKIQNIDSIKESRRLAKVKAEKEAEDKALKEYKNSHSSSWNFIPVSLKSLYCKDCEKSIDIKDDSLLCMYLRNDSIYFVSNNEEGLFGMSLVKAHIAYIPESLNNDNAFKYHVKAFKDSLEFHEMNVDKLKAFNAYCLLNHIEEVRKIAPFGYIDNWSWDDEFSVSFEVEYMNLNAKTIKYIDFYWTIYNDVDDVRGSGHFSCTGPVEELETGSWSVDHSMYYVAGDASTMRITKIVITYMDGTKRTLTGKNIIIKDEEE